MYKRGAVHLASLGVFAFAAVLCCTDHSGGVGVGVANAKEFYTRKRVNGRWITGHFTKRERARTSQRKPRIPRAAQATPTRLRIAEQPSSPPAIQPVIREEPLGIELSGQPPLVVSAPPLSAEPPLTSDDRLLKLQEALLARAASLTLSPSEEQSSGVQTTGSVAVPNAPRSVHFNFQSGIRTTIHADGSIITEPFDPAVEQRIAPASRP